MAIPIATTNLYLQIANVTQYLAANQNANNRLSNWGAVDTSTDRVNLLNFAYNTLTWAKQFYPNDAAFTKSVNYMFTLIGSFYNQANSIVTNANGNIIINPATGKPSTIVFTRIQFTIGQGGAPILAGGTTYTIADTSVSVDSIVVSIDGIVTPRGLSGVISYTATPVTGTSDNPLLTFNQGAINTQVYLITYQKYVAL